MNISRRAFLWQSIGPASLVLGNRAAFGAANDDKIPDSALRLTTRLISSERHRADTDLDSITWTLGLTYLNLSDRAIVLPPSPSNVISHWLTRADETWDLKKGSTDTLLLWDATQRRYFRNGTPVILKPGRTVSLRTKDGTFIARDPGSKISGATLPGRYSLRIQVNLWPDGEDVHQPMYAAWRTLGYLWTGSPISEPMDIVIS